MVKKTAWHTTFGGIEVRERVFIRPKQQCCAGDSRSSQPFSMSAGVHCRGCSLPLQRVIVDFGAGHAFGRMPEKLQEHYGISLPVSTIQKLTEHHANQLFEQEKQARGRSDKTDCVQQIGELDGSMIPIVEIDEEAKDKRKSKKLCRQEARLSIVHEKGSVSPKFGAVFQGNVDDAGRCLLSAAVLAGFWKQTRLHAVWFRRNRKRPSLRDSRAA